MIRVIMVIMTCAGPRCEPVVSIEMPARYCLEAQASAPDIKIFCLPETLTP